MRSSGRKLAMTKIVSTPGLSSTRNVSVVRVQLAREAAGHRRRIALGLAPALAFALALAALFARARRTAETSPAALEVGIAPLTRSTTTRPAPSDMVRLSALNQLQLGIDPDRYETWCRKLESQPEICARAMQRIERRTLDVGAFDLDRTEVSSATLSEWMNRKLGAGEARAQGAVVVRSQDGVALWQPQCHGLGAYTLVSGRVEPRHDPHFSTLLPAACISVVAAQWYCRDLGRRLPSDAEWERAAGGREKRFLPWDATGGVYPRCSDAVFGRVEDGECQRSPHSPARVDEQNLDVTPEGIRALGGNVSEWVTRLEDEAAVSTYEARGGSWAGLAIDLHPSKRMQVDPASVQFASVGFRCAATVAPSSAPE